MQHMILITELLGRNTILERLRLRRRPVLVRAADIKRAAVARACSEQPTDISDALDPKRGDNTA